MYQFPMDMKALHINGDAIYACLNAPSKHMIISIHVFDIIFQEVIHKKSSSCENN